MVKISFTSQARKDIKEIKQYIFFDSPLQAKRVTEKIVAEIQKLSKHPQLSRPVYNHKKGCYKANISIKIQNLL